jgi:hypothetical protein
MGGKLAAILLVLSGIAPAGSFAMSAPRQEHSCRVVGAEKLPAAAGGADAICAAIQHAVAAQAPNARFSAEVRVVTPSMLATKLVVNGRALPEQKFAVMDRKLGASSVERFAKSIAAEVARAAKA